MKGTCDSSPTGHECDCARCNARAGKHRVAGEEHLADTNTTLLFSAVSITEIAIKQSIGKLQLSPTAVDQAISEMLLTLLTYTPEHARNLLGLPLHHRDPFDRMLVAAAMAEKVPLVSTDPVLMKYPVDFFGA